ncbi:hypothetical protein [Streptomyces zingiberis]|uniref:MFS transporter n=1 Tax=Streptomyces zingiberis TaxID=2053010 RepID=A0ABX1BT89_9ACTN|nr:hypothetical protein [Streptomyces zingiberis]NJQ00308.1 hypothetical protein [Streptomyces zingiberis]
MERWWKWMASGVVSGGVFGVIWTVMSGGSWGWEFVAQCAVCAVVYSLMGPLLARSRRRAEERDAEHMRAIREARQGRRR